MTVTSEARADERPVDRWLARRRALVLVALVALSALVRWVYFAEIAASPLARIHAWSQSDMSFFHAWGMRVAQGDWLTDAAFHPHHGWHAAFAAEHLAAHPAEAPELERLAAEEGRGRTAGELLWDRWYGGKRFHQEPLYPYLVGLTYALAGPDPRGVYAWQMAAGVAINLLAWRLARRIAGETAGALAGLAAALYGPLLFYELLLLRTTLLVLASLALADAAAWAFEDRSWRRWAAVGLLGGLALLLKTTFALFQGGLGLLVVWRLRGDRPALLRALAALAAGTLLALLPAVARNLAVGAPATSLSSVAAVGVLSANAEDTVGRPEVSLGSRHLPEVFAETGGSFLPTLIATLHTNDGAWSYLADLGARFLWIWHAYEIPDNACFDHFALYAPILRRLPVTFLWIAPLGLVGLWIARRNAAAAPLALMALASIPPLVLFGAISRYRLPLCAALIPFAATAAVEALDAARLRRTGRLVAILAAALLLALFVGRGLPPDQGRVRFSDHALVYEIYYGPEALRAESAGDWSGAADLVRDSLRVEPDAVRALGPDRPARTEAEARLAGLYAEARRMLALYLRRAGRTVEAEVVERRRDDLLQAGATRFEPAAR